VADLVAIDTSILVDQERGVLAAHNCVSSLVRSGRAAVHPMSCAEMLIGARDRRHLSQMKALLGTFRPLAVRNEDFARVLALLEAGVLADRIDWPDCLIAATCLRMVIPIVTVNDRDFNTFKGLGVIRPY
jgi:predicted nucleic acid-binding protein